jgi:hypothetical protein
MVLERVAASGTSVELARFEKVVVTRMSTAAGDATVEQYEMAVASMKVTEGAAQVGFDTTTNTASCTNPCPCQLTGSAGLLGPYTQGAAAASIASGNIRVDAIDVALHDDVVVSASGGASASKPVLDGIDVVAPLETSGVCSMYYAALGAHVADVHLGIAAASVGASAPVESTTWDSCLTVVSLATIAKGPSGPREQLRLQAGGLVRTDRTIDPATGAAVVGKDSTVGWSFIANHTAASCSGVLP